MKNFQPLVSRWPLLLLAYGGFHSTRLLISYILVLKTFLRPDIIVSHGQILEHCFRMTGLTFFVLGTLLAFFRKPVARWAVVVGAIAYIAPWLYQYYELVTSQPQSHLKWHMLKIFPKAQWAWLSLPIVMLVAVFFTLRFYRANPAVHADSAPAALRR